MAARSPLSDSHHIIRYVPPSKRFVDEEGNYLGPAPGAFALRDTDKGGLSVTEIEHFGPMSAPSRARAAAAHRNTLESGRLAKNAAFAWAQVGRAKIAAAEYGKRIRVVHDPVPGNPAHAEVRHFTDEDLDLLDHFATDVFVDFEVVSDMDIPA